MYNFRQGRGSVYIVDHEMAVASSFLERRNFLIKINMTFEPGYDISIQSKQIDSSSTLFIQHFTATQSRENQIKCKPISNHGITLMVCLMTKEA